MTDHDDGVDLAVAAFREDGEWVVADLTHDHLVDLDSLAGGLRQLGGLAGALGMVVFEEDFLLLVRVEPGRTRVLLSDITAAEDWDLAASALEHLGLPLPEDDDDPVPAGHLDILSDLGVSIQDLADLLDDEDLYPDEMLSDVARTLGFGDLFDDADDLTSA
ncbi:tRNA adenosine deaminase-associated protein [Nocardioides sp.]|uniref:tRNA adenosine deaminase-associated protein n=1 Tax=Nocardioides sp. TaxID=35761 RepID=UPI00356A363D